MKIHIYNRQDDGATLEHTTGIDQDYGGTRGVTGPVRELCGWPTHGMRLATDSAGNTMAWYIGVDRGGRIVEIKE